MKEDKAGLLHVKDTAHWPSYLALCLVATYSDGHAREPHDLNKNTFFVGISIFLVGNHYCSNTEGLLNAPGNYICTTCAVGMCDVPKGKEKKKKT